MTSLYRLVFTSSVATDATPSFATDLADIVRTSRCNNERLELTAGIVVRGDTLMQVMDGPLASIRAVFHRIRHDRRHRDIRVLHRGPTGERAFPGHAMLLIGRTATGRRRVRRFSPQAAGAGEALPAAIVAAMQNIASGEARPTARRRRGRRAEAFSHDEAARPGAAPPGTGRASRPAVLGVATPDAVAEDTLSPPHDLLLAAVAATQAVVQYSPDGTIIDANPIFLAALGHARADVVGRHHRMFLDVEPGGRERAEAEERAFWQHLAAGHPARGTYDRIGANGRRVRLQASYVPIPGPAERPVRIVQLATDITGTSRRQPEQQWQTGASRAGHCVLSFDLDGFVLDADRNFLALSGYARSEIVGRHHRLLVDPAEAAAPDYAAFWKDLASGGHRAGEFRQRGKDGREFWLQATYSPVPDARGRPSRIVAHATDITAATLERADVAGQIAAIRKSQGVISFSLDGVILDVNRVMLDILGYEAADLVGHHHARLVEPAERASEAYVAFWAELRRGNHASGLYRRIGRDGRRVWIQATYNPIFDPAGRLIKVIKFASDVTSSVALAEALEDARRQTQHDPATTLPNRLRLASFMTSALAEADARLVVLYIDLDRFKAVNDSFGHPVGDRVLGEIADRLRRSLSSDQIVARVGGDEFVVVAPDLGDEEVEAFCRRLMAAASTPIRHEGGKLVVTLSVGIAASPADGRTPDDLLRAADAALHRSKRIAPGGFGFHSAAMNDRILGYRRGVDEMRDAIAAGQFFLEYQPRFDAETRRLQSFEALARWQHPVRGRVPPAEFIPIAEKSGLISEIGAWVLRRACRTASSWDGPGVSVNVSPVQFRGGELAATVARILAEEGLPPHRLEIEVTESVLLDDGELARTVLTDLKALGVRLAMDDFGTGYSSLSTLRSYPFDVIKIDRRFISDLDDRKGGREVVQAIIGLGRALGLLVTAEGVETEEQLRTLASDRCDEIQGFLLGRPMPGWEAIMLVRQQERGRVPLPAAAADRSAGRQAPAGPRVVSPA